MKIENLTNNLSTMVESVTNKKSKQKNTTVTLLNDKCYKLFLKFYDHCNLAVIQRAVYLKTERDFKKVSEETKADIDDHLKRAEKKMESLEKNIMGQLASLVSIFTALSFVVFGGISVLENLLQNIRVLPVLKILFVADLWMLCMINLFWFFVELLARLISKESLNIKKKCLIINVILGAVLAILIILFFVFYRRLGYPKFI